MVYQDIDIWGNEQASGQALEYFSSQAVKNAFVMWLSSKKGEYLMNTGAGGPLDNFVFKNMNSKSLIPLKFQLMNAITNNFYPALKVNTIEFSPDYTNNILEIQIYYTILETGISDAVSVFTNTTYAINNFEYEDIPLEGQNLVQFFTVKKPSMPTARLVYDHSGDFWRWGKYKILYSPADPTTDPVFQQILIIANGS